MRGKSKVQAGRALARDAVDAFTCFICVGQDHLDSIACRTRCVHDLNRQAHLVACKCWLGRFDPQGDASKISQSIWNRDQENRSQQKQEQVNCCAVLTRRRVPHRAEHKQERSKTCSGISQRKLLLSRDGHAVKQIISECPSALTRLFEIVPEPMRHDCHSYGLDIFGKEHLTSVH